MSSGDIGNHARFGKKKERECPRFIAEENTSARATTAQASEKHATGKTPAPHAYSANDSVPINGFTKNPMLEALPPMQIQ
ncbi:hypothetical protein N7523_002701 [Penicillium sp. IBT 18751x]|nr:hypothetical protein N7523_002701 [Penicillium sp. IBT 18751x]